MENKLQYIEHYILVHKHIRVHINRNILNDFRQATLINKAYQFIRQNENG